ncbi:uncharacterized protein H6S33_010049 [Morchella sextelata]|uniref:uncharacterized protein n=1 Tax=Morchella sextelata TaxID=1174677 RepID=UPI001D053668|nr:uncharacterized protein H6S33_010049 [Morchella sextelata]KAH0611997.1 hypothetical protein H6S33_010049 [Morchella sextelata]
MLVVSPYQSRPKQAIPNEKRFGYEYLYLKNAVALSQYSSQELSSTGGGNKGLELLVPVYARGDPFLDLKAQVRTPQVIRFQDCQRLHCWCTRLIQINVVVFDV